MAQKKLVHLEVNFAVPIPIGEWVTIWFWVHQVGGPPLVPEDSRRSLIYNGFLELVASPPQATIFMDGHAVVVWIGGTHRCAGIAQLVERNLAKVEVASSNLVSRSTHLPLTGF